jgi:hypothetical protein
MEDMLLIIFASLFLLIILSAMYYYKNKIIVALKPPTSYLFSEYYSLSPLKDWGYNLSYTQYYPIAPNYCFDDSESAQAKNSWAIPDPYAPRAKTIAKKFNNAGQLIKDDQETADLYETLRLRSHKSKVGDWSIYNSKTLDRWDWKPEYFTVSGTSQTVTIPAQSDTPARTITVSPPAPRVGGYWVRVPFSTWKNKYLEEPKLQQHCNYLAYLYLLLDKGKVNIPVNSSQYFIYWGNV